MKKQVINFSWPAQLIKDFAKTLFKKTSLVENLKVFYKGETADHRSSFQILSVKN